tara:strand:- start:9776 stop:11905 length:2130 start_codon:yes stop_codon:yes gene_type:complete
MNKIFITLIIIIIFFRQIIFLNANNDTYINTTNIIYNEEDGIVELAQNSKINIDNTNILVDRGIIDYKNEKIEIFGNFYLYQELNILSGKDLVGDTNFKNFSAIDVSYIYNNNLKIDSDKIKKSENILYFYNNFLTPCELDGYFGCPTWSLRIDKTKYDIDKDKFVHFDTFLQIADYKLFYLPYFSHYGTKAPREKGFLTPTLEFVIGGDSGIYTPYYLPIKDSTDMKLTPKFSFSENFEFINNYSLNTILKHKMSGGNFELFIDNIKYENRDNINTSARLNLRNVLDKNKIIYFEGLVTNSVSTTRSLNEEPVKFENIYLRLDNYDFYLKDDYFSTEISTVEAYDSTNVSLVPITPFIKYRNYVNINKNVTNYNDINFLIIKRNGSQNNLASESSTLKINNYFTYNKNIGGINTFNKITLLNSINNYTFEHNNDLNGTDSYNHLIFSSDYFFNKDEIIKPRIKLIYNQDLHHTENIMNEDSDSITFNLQNLYSDNRFFGTDLRDNTSRIVYGFESQFEINNQKLEINAGQSYDFNKNNKYSNKINQNSHFSDIALEAKINFRSLNLNLNTRLDKSSFNNKETNIALNADSPLNVSLNYYETSKDAFFEKSNDTEYLSVNMSKEINDNIKISYGSNIDLKNNYSPFYEKFGLEVFDECSKLSIEYANRRYNDNYNTSPEELISISYYMDYLGFFGYQQTTNLFSKEAEN